MSRGRSGRRSVNVWPALSDTVLAFLLTVILLLTFVVANLIRIGPGEENSPEDEDQRKVKEIVEDVSKTYGGIKTKTFGNAQEITLGNEVLFSSGSASLSEDGRKLMSTLVDRIADADLTTLREIVVKGHTDDVPVVNGQFPTNWELSTARASRVVRALIRSEEGKQRINPNEVNLVASGYSKYQPVDPNNLSANRRIELRLVYSTSRK